MQDEEMQIEFLEAIQGRRDAKVLINNASELVDFLFSGSIEDKL